MAKARFSQPSIRPRSTAMLLVPVVVSTVVGLGLMFSGRTAVLISGARGFLEYYAGVFTLVSLSITVMVGLIATDRMVLSIPHRILLQAAHRGTALTSMAFLGVHITLTSEWRGYRWRPLTGGAPETGLVDDYGFFHATRAAAVEHACPEAAYREIIASLG